MFTSARESIVAWRGKTEHFHLVRSTFGMFGVVLIQAAGGFVFWVVAARTTDAVDIGFAGALISSGSFVIYATNFGIATVVSRFAIGDNPQARLRFTVSLAITFVSTGIGSVVCWATFLRKTSLGSTPVVLVIFVVGTAALSSAPLLDIRLAGLRRMRLLFGRVGLVTVLKLAVLPFVSKFGGNGVYLAASIPDTAVLLGVAVLGAPRILRDRRSGARLEEGNRLARFASSAYLSQITMNATILILPVIVLVHVPAETNGSFFLAWSVASVVVVIPQAAMIVLQIEGGRNGADVGPQFRFALRIVSIVTVLTFAMSILFAPIVPILYGPDFSQTARLLPWLMAGCIPWGIVAISMADARARERPWLSVMIGASASVACLPVAWVLTSQWGVWGTVCAWLGGMAVASVVAVALRKKDLSGRQFAK